MAADLSGIDTLALYETTNYLAEHARAGTTPPEGSFLATLRSRSPQEQGLIAGAADQWEMAEKNTHAPFHPAPTTQSVADHYQADPEDFQRVYQRFEDEVITEGLVARMGDDSDRPAEEPSLRDEVAAALDIHSGE